MASEAGKGSKTRKCLVSPEVEERNWNRWRKAYLKKEKENGTANTKRTDRSSRSGT